jgi:hypothetical protein
MEKVREIPVALRLLDYQLKDLIKEYAALYSGPRRGANCNSLVWHYINSHSEEIGKKVNCIGRTMLLASLSEDFTQQSVVQEGFRCANTFVTEGIAALLTGIVASPDLLNLLNGKES